jgi:subtilisin family serine protease/subtilisin-like proprotein convertase family protein
MLRGQSQRPSPKSLARAAGRPGGGTHSRLEALEPRVLLSTVADHPDVASFEWRGSEITVMEDSWLVTFESSVSRHQVEKATARVANELGVLGWADIEVIGARFGLITVNNPRTIYAGPDDITEQRIDEVVRSQRLVMAIDPNTVYAAQRVPNDELFGQQWHHENIGEPVGGFPATAGADISSIEAWDTTIGSRSAIVAVIDTGVEWNHPDLAANIWTNPGEIAGNGVDDDGNGFVDDIRGWDFGTFDNNPDDDSLQPGHGTAVAGVIGAVGDNGLGVVGVNWNVSILPMKIANDFGFLTLAAVVGAHDYLTMMRGLGHNIVASNNSYGAFAPDFYAETEGFVAEREAIRDFIATGATFVAAAGNAGADLDGPFDSFPASYDVPGIISVAATDFNDARAVFSNYGATQVHLGAPGVDILTTTINGGYTFINGTSFSSPLVAGAVALLKTVQPDASAVAIREALMNGADRIPALQGITISGGRLNVARSLEIIGITGPVVTSIQPGPITGAPVNEIVVRFNKELAPLGADVLDHIELLASGGDGTFGDGNETIVGLSGAVLGADGRSVTVTPVGPLGAETYRLTLDDQGFQDTLGNFLNGDTVSGEDEVYTFRVENVSGKLEPNDTLASAHVVDFGSTGGTVSLAGLTIGDGTQAALDVDLFRVDMSRGGLINAKVIAQQLLTPSSFDSYLRLFDAAGNELAANDQFFGNDSFIDFFVTTGGTYYVGVSGFPNADYDPAVAGSGISQSTGAYNLEITVSLVADDVLSFEAGVPAGGLSLPDAATTSSFIFITDTREILDVDVRIDIEHDFVGDLSISLFAPDGTEVVLVNRRGGSGENFTGTVFDDEAPVSVASMTPSGAPYTGSFRPETPLGAFDGGSAAGQWTLVVRDNAPLNEGRLLGWDLEITLRNDIFGPFELNDTLTTARDLQELAGFGTAQRSAAIGDGAFGALDVDLFRFTAAAGSTMSAIANAGSVNTALRLFDSAGRELTFSSPSGTFDSQIDQFVFVTGGTYYIGVSEAAGVGTLDAYDPTQAASGVPAETTGAYTLTATLSPGVIDNGATLEGERLRAAITATGALSRLSLDGEEFLVDLSSPSPQAFFGATANRNSFRNDGVGGDNDIPFFFQTESDPFNSRAYMETTKDGLRVERSISFGVGDQFLAVDVSLTNTTSVVMTNVAWMEALNAQQGLNQAPGTTERTVNDLVDGSPLATSSFFNTIFDGGLTVAIGAIGGDDRATAVFITPTTLVRDPQQLLTGAVGDPGGAADDLVMGLHYDLGVLDANTTATMRYFIFLAQDVDEITGPNGLYATMNRDRADGQRLDIGHLTMDPSDPAPDSSGLPDLAYRSYYPEGYANDRSSTFVPIVNPTSRDARIVIVARYETGARDQVLFDGVVAAGSRSPDALTITTPEMYAAGTQLVRKDTPYALEIRSDAPVLATMSHFDFGFSTGEAFSNQVSDTWTFADLEVGGQNRDFLVFLNTSDQTQKIITTLLPAEGGPAITLTATVGAHRRAGWNLHNENIPAGRYGAIVEAQLPFVAAATSFNTQEGGAYGLTGTPGLGATAGAIPEGEVGLRTDEERISILNAGPARATVTLTFLFDSGAADRRLVEVGGRRRVDVNVQDFVGFPAGRAYSVLYESTQPVVVSSASSAGGEALAASGSSRAHTLWGFSEGFRPVGSAEQVTEYLRIFNPSVQEQVVEITIRFTDGSSEVFRGSVLGRTVGEFNLHDFISPERVAEAAGMGLPGVFYGLTVKTAAPVVAYMGRTDLFFQGSFGTLGVPLGLEGTI